MGLTHSGNIVTNGLVLCLDAANRRSYPGIGTAWTDLSGKANNGTLTNGPTFSTENNGTIVFDGTDDYISNTTSTLVSGNTNCTLQCWVNISNTSKKGAFVHVGQRDGYSIGIGTNDFDFTGNQILGLFANNRWITTSTNYGTGWKFVTFVVDGSGVPSIYNGLLLIGSYPGLNAATPTAGYSIARNIGDESSPRAFNGKIPIVLVYNIPLSFKQIQQNYNATRKRFGL